MPRSRRGTSPTTPVRTRASSSQSRRQPQLHQPQLHQPQQPQQPQQPNQLKPQPHQKESNLILFERRQRELQGLLAMTNEPMAQVVTLAPSDLVRKGNYSNSSASRLTASTANAEDFSNDLRAITMLAARAQPSSRQGYASTPADTTADLQRPQEPAEGMNEWLEMVRKYC
eukprot:NODE_5533_length_667_cov_25.677994_g5157_i0.p1 GENE.NODE_5533_length_667_cov_25.677994_g5157_i0~~NODE_5533_length_667_cov_25.677994_g5157_i0.p1  ORF type:complete len:192 (+),score=26.87 NODE_5533_length_667_cov_25.677994_g5157_i0:65-577(+)